MLNTFTSARCASVQLDVRFVSRETIPQDNSIVAQAITGKAGHLNECDVLLEQGAMTLVDTARVAIYHLLNNARARRN